ncbi:Uncharacterised protein [Mycobacteroides abscessus subsp. abscessus]|nr:Uncharacterised protein [Mycobacteroides abscessus subsp. abscessus]
MGVYPSNTGTWVCARGSPASRSCSRIRLSRGDCAPASINGSSSRSCRTPRTFG